MSSFVLKSPNVKRIAPFANSLGKPIAVRTCDGLLSPEEQAEPPDAQMPISSSLYNSSVASWPSKLILIFPGNRFSIVPFIWILGKLCLKTAIFQ